MEGYVNRIKMIKRQMFGRAGFALLRSHYGIESMYRPPGGQGRLTSSGGIASVRLCDWNNEDLARVTGEIRL
ncbi:hypothetical protein [Streptosporangium roseum]|uniref:hypothetical protein n=1 Tax=Streptosporangium roseum TaxID=2001 RepID=UPI00332C2A1B